MHSYYIEAGNPAQVAGRGHYGKDFAAALAEGSRFAVQFHPEKSHTHGLQLLQNFVELGRPLVNEPGQGQGRRSSRWTARRSRRRWRSLKSFLEDRFELELGVVPGARRCST